MGEEPQLIAPDMEEALDTMLEDLRPILDPGGTAEDSEGDNDDADDDSDGDDDAEDADVDAEGADELDLEDEDGGADGDDGGEMGASDPEARAVVAKRRKRRPTEDRFFDLDDMERFVQVRFILLFFIPFSFGTDAHRIVDECT